MALTNEATGAGVDPSRACQPLATEADQRLLAAGLQIAAALALDNQRQAIPGSAMIGSATFSPGN